MSADYIYFMRPVGEAGPIKIGYSRLPDHRLKQYQQWSPQPLEIVARLPVYRPENRHRRSRAHVQIIERGFHERYLPWHLHHEWFFANQLIEADIAAIVGGTFDIAVLPPHTHATWRLSSALSVTPESAAA